MKKDLILANIAKHIQLEEEECKYFLSLLQEKTVKKKAYILKHGQYCHYINFVHSGTLRAYYLNDKGKESTIMFAPCLIIKTYSQRPLNPKFYGSDQNQQTIVWLLQWSIFSNL